MTYPSVMLISVYHRINSRFARLSNYTSKEIPMFLFVILDIGVSVVKFHSVHIDDICLSAKITKMREKKVFTPNKIQRVVLYGKKLPIFV